ncbi:KEOPS complex subunit Pcc1 [Methanobacterium alcaliphilum]|uniref:KEOPS complex subunit Pcc1 n=1 Tax=Methanobacterium alcaliphilum TaxID=392018 RepID=UPI00200A68E7|nr:KEOPS complex subunit Pcc1 [Methanobacterium alcaliphilum]MCK9150575.1 hypothetical protein [Methanobacterium alcaliphilum]
MHIKTRITLEYHDKNQAKIASESLNPDNMGFVKTKLEDNKLICKIQGESLRTILATADDLLFSEITVENIEKLSRSQLKKPPSSK